PAPAAGAITRAALFVAGAPPAVASCLVKETPACEVPTSRDVRRGPCRAKLLAAPPRPAPSIDPFWPWMSRPGPKVTASPLLAVEIGRASCRERVWRPVRAMVWKNAGNRESVSELCVPPHGADAVDGGPGE